MKEIKINIDVDDFSFDLRRIIDAELSEVYSKHEGIEDAFYLAEKIREKYVEATKLVQALENLQRSLSQERSNIDQRYQLENMRDLLDLKKDVGMLKKHIVRNKIEIK